MLILSAFTSDYLHKPLQHLLQNFSSEILDIKYTDTNLLIWLTKLHSSEEKNQTITILFRLIDLIEVNNKIDLSNLKENINKVIKQIIELKKIKKQSLIVTLCPSPDCFYDKEFKELENYFLEEMQVNKIHTLSQSDIHQHYALSDFDNKVEYETRIPYTFEFYAGLACLIARKLHCITQPPYKVIVVDCDNTLWTGIAGDIGPENVKFEEHNRDLQKFLVQQKENGVLICLCSKNEEETVDKVFSIKKDEMILKMSDVALKKINRDIKSNSIKAILSELKLANAKNAMFIDDSPREIDEVSQSLPEIFCVLMPQTIQEFNKIWAFDINEYLSVTQTDKNRLKLIQEDEALRLYSSQINDPIENLKAIRMKKHLVIKQVLNSLGIKERIKQMLTRINQFSLCSLPEYLKCESNLENLIKNNEIDCFIASIQNKLVSADKKNEDNEDLISGDLTALAICKKNSDSLLVNGFFLSCRNTGLEVEYALAKQLAIHAKSKNLNKIQFKFKKTEVNKLAETFIDILCQETHRTSAVRFLLKNTKNSSLVQSSLLYVFKKFGILPIDFDKVLGKEIIFEFSVNSLILLDPYVLMRKTIELNAVNNNISSERLISPKDLGNAKLYLSLIQNETGTIEPLVEKFFLGSRFKLIDNLIENITEKLNLLLSIQTQNFPKNASLVHLGLDSLIATHLSASIYKDEKVIVPYLMLLGPEMTVSSLLEYIKQLKKEQQNVIEQKSLAYEFNQSGLPSFQEQRIWFAEQKEPTNNSANYHMTACYKVTKNLDTQRFEASCQKLMKIYDVFGTTFFIQDNELKQSILSPGARRLNFQVQNLETSLEEAIQLEISKPWSMESEDPLIRFIIFEDTQSYHIFIHVHHAIFDAVSLKNCLDTLSEIYQHTTQNSPEFIDYPPQYFEFIYAQQKKLEDAAYQVAALNFWKNTLSKIETVTTLPTDQPLLTFKPATEQSAQRFAFSLSTEDLLALKALVKSTEVTCFSAIYGLFGLLISAYSFQTNITLITATNGRGGHPSFDKMVGFFVNLLVQPFDLEKNHNFINYLKQINKKVVASQEFQEISFNKIQEILSKQGINDILLSPAFIYQSYAIPELRIDNEIAELEIPQQPIIFDLRNTCRFGHFTLFGQENDQELTFVIEYAKDLFSTSFIESFARNLLHTIRNVCKNPNQKLHDISVVSDEERSQLICLGQGPKLDYVENDNLVSRFQQIVEKHPDNEALCYGKKRLTYKELDQQSSNLAHALIQKGVRQGDYIGIFLEPDHLFYIAELSALKIGAVFIPLSKEDPYDRLKSIIEDAKIKFFIVDDTTKGLFDTDFQGCKKVPICCAQTQCLAVNLPLLTATMENNACILYTSGSTGMPKGVVLTQKAIFRVIVSLGYLVKPEDNIAQTANQVFDAAQLELFLAFLNGARLVILDKNVLLDAKLFTKELTDKNITVMWLTAGLFNLYGLKSPLIFKEIKYLMSGGDIVDKKAVEQVLDAHPNLQFMNGYGPTETGIFALTYLVDRENLKKFIAVPIGRPTIANTQIVILNAFNGLAPQGAIGQLGILGDGLGRYHNNEVLQKKCFLTFSKNQMIDSLQREILLTQIYMTGDKVQFKNKQIWFLGRMNDEQLKIRGNLVSLPEIKHALEKHPAIKQAEILYKTIHGQNKALIVFYTTNEKNLKPKKEQLIQFLSTKLLAAMIPIYYKKIKKFSLTANGKLDRNTLSKLSLNTNDENDSDKENISESLTKIQEKLLSIFKDLLPFIPNLDSNFFDIGGNSIEAIQLLAKIEEVFDKKISFNNLRNNSTIRSLSLILEEEACPKNDLLSLLYKGSDEKLPPIIFIHPAGGGLFCFNKLIKGFQDSNLANYCFGIEDPVILDRQVKKITIPEMAANYLKYIHEKIKGPFILAGYSFGGMVALEMAAQLESSNHKNLRVILLDTWVVSCAKENLKKSLRAHVIEYCKEVIQNVSANPKVEIVENLIQPMMDQCIYYQEIGFEFIPTKLHSTCTTLFKANDTEKFEGMEEETQSNYLEKFIVAKNLKKYMVEGNHFNMLEKHENLVFLSKKIVEYINNIETKFQTTSSVKIGQTIFFQNVDQDTNILYTSSKVLSLRN